LPSNQPTEISASIQAIVLAAEQVAAISAVSPHVRLINTQVIEKIAAHYSMADEIKLIRTQPSAEFEVYNAHAEDCRAWGRLEKGRLGL
jgi:hypothetical protein